LRKIFLMSKTFSELGIKKVFQQSLSDLNITEPTNIQEKVIPNILFKKKDIVGLAKTGSGKTLAFGLPLLQLIDVENTDIQGLIIAPTRELAQQIHSNLESYTSDNSDIRITAIYGGTTVKSQTESLKSNPQIVVATPGRLVDLIERCLIDIQTIKYLVLDEADELITAFKDDLETIKEEIPKRRRTFLFTATMTGKVKQMIQNYMSKHITQLDAEMTTVGHQDIDHQFVVVEPIEKLNVLMHFLNSKLGERGIIFCKTKAAVNKLGKNLAINKFSSGAIHGSLTQGIRDRIMGQFREGHINILVATDLAARGIDVKAVSYVINYHLPDTYDAYVHRSGRTARAGESGFALTVLQEEETVKIADFEEELGIKFTEFKKADAQSIEDNNTVLWARKIFKTKPNREVSGEVKGKVKKIFHHLTKEELIEKLLADYLNKDKNTK